MVAVHGLVVVVYGAGCRLIKPGVLSSFDKDKDKYIRLCLFVWIGLVKIAEA